MKQRFVRNCNMFAVPGKSSFQYVTSLGVAAERICTAPNAVDIHRFARLTDCARQRAGQLKDEQGLPPRYFLYVGRMIREKGVFQLLEAYARLEAQLRSKVGLVFVGNGKAKAELMKQAARIQPGAVQFLGFAQRDQLAAFYALSEALVFPTLSDPWGLVVNEAMACGLPIIATDVAGCTADLVQEGGNGYVIPANNVGKLAEAMAAIALDPQLAQQMGRRSATLIEAYSPELCAAGLALAAGVPAQAC